MLEQHSNIPYEIFTIKADWEKDQISKWLNFVKNANPKNRTFTDAAFKNGKIIEPEISNSIWQYIQPKLDSVYEDADGIKWKFQGVTKYVMYAVIEPGQSFPIHTDTGAEYSSDGESKFTVLVYLNHDFEGGTTQFYTHMFEKTIEIKPYSGKILVFDINLFHAGMPVKNGTKYWIGTEIICSKITK